MASERRSRNSTVFKLRFRHDGRQRVIYLGMDMAFVEEVRSVLKWLQRRRRHTRELSRTSMFARQELRRAKKRLAEELPCQGYKFHGMAIRKTRQSRPQIVT